jgi:hypothetical protein
MSELPANYGDSYLTHILTVVFNGGGPSDSAAAYSKNFIRLCDLAIHEYKLARKTLTEYINTPNEVISVNGLCKSVPVVAIQKCTIRLPTELEVKCFPNVVFAPVL